MPRAAWASVGRPMSSQLIGLKNLERSESQMDSKEEKEIHAHVGIAGIDGEDRQMQRHAVPAMQTVLEG